MLTILGTSTFTVPCLMSVQQFAGRAMGTNSKAMQGIKGSMKQLDETVTSLNKHNTEEALKYVRTLAGRPKLTSTVYSLQQWRCWLRMLPSLGTGS